MYTIQVSDANGCNATSTSIITQPPILTISNATFTNPTCLGMNDGTITVVAAGGTPAYTYTLSPGAVVAANGQFNNLIAGTYTIVVSDAYNCTVSTVLNLSPPALNFTMNTLSNLYCNCAGSVEIVNIGGGVAPYNYTINPVANQPTPGTFDNMCGGNYTITVTDINSCSGSTVIIANQIQLSNTSTNSQCNGVDNGSIICTPALGAPPYTFTLNPGNIINGTGIFNNLAAGIYTIGVVDANLCTNSIIDTLTDINNINLTTNLDTIICGVQGPSYFFPNGGAGGGAYTYTVMPGNIVQNVNLYTNLNAGNYTVTISNPAGCIKVAPFDIIQLSGLLPTAVNSAVQDESCYMAGDGAIDIIPANPFGLTYQWNNNMVTQDLVNITSGSYTVKISDINGDCTVLNSSVNFLGINCGTVSGHIFHDANSNCQQDPGENDANNVHLSLSNGALAVTNNAGDYQFSNVPYGSYSIAQNNNILLVPNACVQPGSVTVNALNNIIQNVDFKDSTMTYTDAAVQITCLPLVPGFNAGYSILVVNNSFNPVTGNLWFKLNNGLIFNSTYPANQGVYPLAGADSIIWNNINIPSYSFLVFYVDALTPANLPIGTLIQGDANFDVTNFPDYNLANHYSQFQSLVQGAFDPNNKSVNPIGEGPNGNITLQDSVLHYLIRFQNTGTDTAHNIFILDTLSDQLDISTLKITAFSHPYTIEILNGHILKFKFDHIMLPDSNVNEPLSHGYIAYSIQQKNTNQIGDVIHNTASIYFDFNAPIITNTTINTIAFPVLLNSQEYEKYFQVYPNPASDQLTVEFNSSSTTQTILTLTNTLGQVLKTVQSYTISGTNKIEFSIKELPKGMYLLKISNGKSQSMKKVVIE
ncbi:MAG: T9SS type A sorting domain-containing protein [Chitinophagaceae bacterium]|nr:T9SS type A sorting domain-containing protein [Chitinophagaceae bacterium]